MMQALNLGAEPAKIAIIHQHVISVPQTLRTRSLYFQDGTHLLFACLITRDGTRDLQHFRHIHDQYAINGAVLP